MLPPVQACRSCVPCMSAHPKVGIVFVRRQSRPCCLRVPALRSGGGYPQETIGRVPGHVSRWYRVCGRNGCTSRAAPPQRRLRVLGRRRGFLSGRLGAPGWSFAPAPGAPWTAVADGGQAPVRRGWAAARIAVRGEPVHQTAAGIPCRGDSRIAPPRWPRCQGPYQTGDSRIAPTQCPQSVRGRAADFPACVPAGLHFPQRPPMAVAHEHP